MKTTLRYNTVSRMWEVQRATTVYHFGTLTMAVEKCYMNGWIFELQ